MRRAGPRRVRLPLDFKAAARLVLEEVGHPLNYGDITEIRKGKYRPSKLL